MRGAVAIIQPEMAHTGVTQFKRICTLAREYDVLIAPHATIGVGIFLAASLHATAATKNVLAHEYQHSIFDRVTPMMKGDMRCESGAYSLPTGSGVGVEPRDELWKNAVLIK